MKIKKKPKAQSYQLHPILTWMGYKIRMLNLYLASWSLILGKMLGDQSDTTKRC